MLIGSTPILVGGTKHGPVTVVWAVCHCHRARLSVLGCSIHGACQCRDRVGEGGGRDGGVQKRYVEAAAVDVAPNLESKLQQLPAPHPYSVLGQWVPPSPC